MEKNKSGSRLEFLNLQRRKLNAKIHKIEAIEKNKQRKIDIRKKILIGSYYLEEALKNGAMDDLKQRMVEFLKRDDDKMLFNTDG